MLPGWGPIAWSPDGRFIFCLVGDGPTTQLAAVTVRSAEVMPLTHGEHEIFQYDLDPSCRLAVAAVSDVVTPGDLWVADLGAAEGQARPIVAAWRRLTSVNQEALTGVALSVPQPFRFEGADGWGLEGWVLPPPGYDPAELFFDPQDRLVKARAALTLARKAAGLRYSMKVVPLDPSPVRGTHGRPSSGGNQPGPRHGDD